MIDMFNLSSQHLNTQVFTASTTQWQTWTKPNNAKMVYIFVLGGGGGGGGGRTSVSNSGHGGGGGASSAITTGIYHAMLLPDTVKGMLELAVGKSRLNDKTEREGVVVRSLDNTISFKAISNKFLLSEK